jgi:hypothetical protein
VVPEEAAVIRQAAQAVLAGGSMASLVRDLTAQGVTTTTGAAWTVTSLRRALTNPRLAGRAVYKGTVVAEDGPVILDPDTFDRLVAVLTDPRRKTAPSTRVKYLLSGIATCGRCGGRMFTTKNSGILVYRCRPCFVTRSAAKVDEVVEAVVVARLSRPDASALVHSAKDVDELRRAKVELADRRTALTTMLGEGLLDPEAAKAQLRRVATDLDDLERELEAAMGESPLADVVGFEDVAGRWASRSVMQKRAIIKALMTVTVEPSGKGQDFRPEQVRIGWR